MGEKLIAFVFIDESCKGIISISIIHERFVDFFEKQSFVIANKNISKRWAKRGTYSHPSFCQCIILVLLYYVLLKLNSTK